MSRRNLFASILMACLLVLGIGAAVSYLRDPPEAAGAQAALSPAHSGPDGEILTRLGNYTRSIGNEESTSTAAASKPLPDVDTMIERLAARLEAMPEDSKGWRMLGWSYFNTARFDQAATAYARALKLDPTSAELKRSYEEATAKALNHANAEMGSSSQAETADKGIGGSREKKVAASEAAPPHETKAAIRAMVDSLANRLESSPQDPDGWARLMRSRVVLGERAVAATAYRTAREIFRDDPAASAKIAAAAIELGLTAE